MQPGNSDGYQYLWSGAMSQQLPKFSKKRLLELAEHENEAIAICAKGILKVDYGVELK